MADSLRGAFVWCELMTTDTAAAGRFYRTVTDWATRPSAGDPNYVEFLANGRGVAGLMTVPEDARKMGVPPNWMVYIGTPDVDATAVQIGALGGHVVRPPADIPGVGRFAVAQDPHGATFAIFTPSTPAPAGPPARGFAWYELYTPDPDAALAFYSSVFGWEKTGSMDMGPGGQYQMFGHGTAPVGGMMKPPPGAPAAWLPYISLKDATTAMATATRLGATVMTGPMAIPGGDFVAIARDPQGAVFAVHSVTPKAAAAPAAPKAAPSKKPAAQPVVKKAASKAAPPKAVKKPKAVKTKPVKKAARKATAKAKPAKARVKTKARPAARKATARKTAARKGTGRKATTRKAAKKASRRPAVRSRKR